MTHPTSPNRKHRVLRVAVVTTVVALLSVPMISRRLHAQDALPAPAAKSAKGAGDMAKVDPKKVDATAGQTQLTQGDFDRVLSQMPAAQQSQIISNADAKQDFARRLLMVKTLAGEAEKRKLDQDDKVKEQLDSTRQQILAQALAMSLSNDEASDRKFFNDHPQLFGQVKARHILISTRGSDDPKNPKPAMNDADAKKKADDVRARLVKGEDFGKLAKAESDDPGSKDTGGEYTFPRGQMVPAFEKAAFGQKENEISQPVKTPFGYHVIQTLKFIPGTFEEARPMIPNQRIEALFNEITGGKITYDPSFTAPVSGPVPAPAPKK